eukprot:CAMPEP_0196740504 /NCGR_PEP_ID=MMETSP1091-20130531/33015_1 /TAXON_ID=302021 /ORGANISM="Rhodomonas sp., Strain CCMP768" /LENGTH=165 /DNA_ID=CAMNT_0042085705 /DNA_START=182 /DNA_END=679 /DNA_ORIENTATION=+
MDLNMGFCADSDEEADAVKLLFEAFSAFGDGLDTAECVESYAGICGSADKVKASDCAKMCELTEAANKANAVALGCQNNDQCPNSEFESEVSDVPACCSFQRAWTKDVCDLTDAELDVMIEASRASGDCSEADNCAPAPRPTPSLAAALFAALAFPLLAAARFGV